MFRNGSPPHPEEHGETIPLERFVTKPKQHSRGAKTRKGKVANRQQVGPLCQYE
jgi:hypothetical protein